MKKIKRVNAEIRDIKQLAERLLAGEKFFFTDKCTTQDKNLSKFDYEKFLEFHEKIGFRITTSSWSDPMNYSHWSKFRDLYKEVEVKWYEDIEEPILCFVGMIQAHVDYKLQIVYVTGFRLDNSSVSFRTQNNQFYSYARPVNGEDLLLKD